jgi:enoyl-CoA hydratase/carnithine racemase
MFKRKQPQPELTNDAYARWLRAQRPPLVMFLGLSALEQEQLAALGDQHTLDLCATLGYALQNPEAVDAGSADRFGTDAESEIDLAKQLAARFAEKLAGKAEKPSESFAGFGSRNRVEFENGSASHKTDALREIFGKPRSDDAEAE